MNSTNYVLQDYDDSLKFILKNGHRKVNRTGVETLSVFGMQSRYRIDDRFPVLTGRKIYPKSIFAELLWFLSGSTNNKHLQALGSNIWTPWVDKEFEKKQGYIPGSFGPIYGFQLRHFGGNYVDGDYPSNTGFDQLRYMINTLKTDPDSRRNLFSLWNPNDLDKQRLPCCHYSFQVDVTYGRLSGMLTQRSCDYPVGVPANILFYSALLYLLAQQCDLIPYELIHSTADSHIYINQIDSVEEYLERHKPPSPYLRVLPKNDILDYQLEDFVLTGYNPMPSIKIPVAV